MRDTQGAKTIQDVTVPRRVARGPRWFVLALAVSSQVFFLPNGTHGQVPLQPAPDPRVQIFDDFAPYPSLPQPLHDGSAGTLGNHLIYAGGRSPAEGSLSRDVYALAAGADTWQQVAELPYGLSHGAAIVWGSQLLIVGGMRADGASAEILQLGEEESGWNIRRFASLPQPMMAPSVALIEDPQRGSRFFAASGALIFELDANHPEGGWTESQPLPVTGPVGPCQLLELDGVLFAFGSAAGAPFALEYTEQRWQAIASPPPGFQPEAVVHSGDAHLLFVGPSPTGQQIFTYHRLTDSWARWGDLPDGVSANRVLTDSNGLYLFGNPAAGEGAAPTYRATFSPSSTMHIADYIALLLYFGLMVVLGVFFARRNKNTETYFEGGRNVAWLAVGMSMFATGASSISFMAMPAKAFAENWKFFLVGPLQCLILPISLFIFIPILRRERISTAYEYLEKRFNLGIRLLGSVSFLLIELARMGVLLYLPALALSIVTGVDVGVSILLMGFLATFYTTLGGIEAVIWTDVFQVVILLGGALLSLGIIVASVPGGLDQIIVLGTDYDKFRLVNLTWDIHSAALWIIIVGMLAQFGATCSNQTTVQRYLTTRDEKAAARAIWTFTVMALPSGLLFFMLGSGLWAFYKTHPELLNPLDQIDQIFPWFIAQQLPSGIAGLVIAALFAASMSSMDSSMNSAATAITTDFYRRFWPRASDRACLNLARGATILLGGFGTVIALFLSKLNSNSIWLLGQELVGLLGSGLAGLFVAGIFTRRTSSLGALLGYVASLVVLYFVKTSGAVYFYLYLAIGTASCVVVAWLASWLLPGRKQDLQGLTIYTIHANSQRDS